MRKIRLFLSLIAVALLVAQVSFADDSARLLRVDHYVRVHSTVPAITGQTSQIYVREVVEAGIALRGPASDRVALFVHGAGTPAEVSFDVPYQDYSWMAYLAHAGFDAFSMDMTGYGRSTRPAPMNDPCNVSREQQAKWVTAAFSLVNSYNFVAGLGWFELLDQPPGRNALTNGLETWALAPKPAFSAYEHAR